MEYAQVVEHLEIALIELEYATADFAEHRSRGAQAIGADTLDHVRRKMISANHALQVALEVLGDHTKLHFAA